MTGQTKKAASGSTSTECREVDSLSATNQPRPLYHSNGKTASVFDAVKDALTMAEVVRFYGYEPNRAGFVCCPFHSEKTASMKVYSRNYHCFGCSAHGSVIDFTANLLGLDSMGAVKRLNEDFNLRLSLDTAPNPQRLQERRQLAHARQLFDEWRRKILNQIDAAIRTANLADYGKLTDAEALALVYREPLEAWADVLMHGTLENQMSVFRDRKEVERLCMRILQHTQARLNAS